MAAPSAEKRERDHERVVVRRSLNASTRLSSMVVGGYSWIVLVALQTFLRKQGCAAVRSRKQLTNKVTTRKIRREISAQEAAQG